MNETTGDTSTYTYYGDGLRATKTENGTQTKYVYLNGKVVEELDSTNAVSARNVWGNELVLRKDMAAGQIGYYHYNSHGDVVAISDGNGQELNSYDYDTWGNVIAKTEGMSNPYQYSGELHDEKTGFYYLRARYYDPTVGRFISEDTYKGAVDNPLSLNRYTYVSNNPLRFVDPSGHKVEKGTGGIGGFTSPIEEYLHWARVAARKAYEEGTEPEDAVRKYVPTQYQEEVLPTAIVTFNTAVGINHGDAPDLGLVAPATGALAGTLKNTSKGTGKVSSINPNEIRFSQSSVNGAKEITESMKANGWQGSSIDVVKMSDGKLTTVDNTRVLAARNAGIDVRATVHNASDLIPADIAQRFVSRNGQVPTTWGEAVTNRIKNQNSSYRTTNPYGSNITGWDGK